jgi:hypothetical protein
MKQSLLLATIVLAIGCDDMTLVFLFEEAAILHFVAQSIRINFAYLLAIMTG